MYCRYAKYAHVKMQNMQNVKTQKSTCELHQLRRGVSKCFNFVLCANDSVSHDFDFMFDLIRSAMPSADARCLNIMVFLRIPVMLSRADLFAVSLSAKVRAANSRAMR
jgi:hypothetical protein